MTYFLTHLDANYCIILCVILMHSQSYYAELFVHFSIFFTVFLPVALVICISVPFTSFFAVHSCKYAIFTHWFFYL